MLRKTSAVLAALALLGVIGGCAGKTKHASTESLFTTYDVNKDGRITQEEYVVRSKDKQKAATAWKRLDQDGNGFVERTLNGDAPLRVWNDVESQDLP
ncbi:EF-hand domain-containing protein [Solidesulfovibrio sp.]